MIQSLVEAEANGGPGPDVRTATLIDAPLLLFFQDDPVGMQSVLRLWTCNGT